MKYHILFSSFLFLLFTIACSEKKSTNISDPKALIAEAEAIEKKGFELFQSDPQKAIPYFEAAADMYDGANAMDKLGITFLNIANIYDEHTEHLDSALIYTTASLQVFKQIPDSMQMANLYKYKGLLLGKKKDFVNAKINILMATIIYQSLEYPQGIAVSNHNLASVLYEEGKVEDGLDILDQANEILE